MASVMFETPLSFSETGKYLSFCEKDGKLKIWDTSTGTLKQEYTKNLHLSSPCSCLLWIQTYKSKSTKKRKLDSEPRVVASSQDVIAVGTTSGSVMLYSVESNSILSEESGHKSKVNSLAWTNSLLYSGSDDKNIVEWDISTHKIKSKWKAGKEKVKAVAGLSCGKRLLSASCSIKLWDLASKDLLKSYVGHSTEIFTLLEVPGRSSYFVSAARGDRVLSAWNLEGKEKNEGALTSFLLQDSAAYINIGNWGEVSTLCAVSESGMLHIFEHKLNGTISKPLKSKLNVSIASDEDKSNGTNSTVPIHAALALESNHVLIAYGNPAFLIFETLILSEYHEEHVVLNRQTRRRTAPDEFNSRVRIPELDGDVKYIAPETPQISRQKSKHQQDVPLEQRLENLALAKPLGDGPKKDNMAQLLIQGLQSRDKDLIHDVLLRQGESVIESTVRHLPIQALQPLLKELTSLIQGKTFSSKISASWLNSVLRIHTAILLSNPELSTLVQPLLSTLEAKVEGLSGLLRLKGRLSLVVDQLAASNQTEEDITEPLIMYQDGDEDTSESEAQSSSDSAEEWDEFSDMDQENEVDAE